MLSNCFFLFFVLLFRLDLAASLFFQANCIWLKQNGQGDSVPNRQSSSNPSRFMLCAKIRKIIYNAPNKISFLTSIRYKESLCENLYIELAFPNVHDHLSDTDTSAWRHRAFSPCASFLLEEGWASGCKRTPCRQGFRHRVHNNTNTLCLLFPTRAACLSINDLEFWGERAQKAYPRGAPCYQKNVSSI